MSNINENKPRKRKPQIKKKTIMFVCTGNTCRSAMAEYIFRNELKKAKLSNVFKVTSSGVMAHEGDGMPFEAQDALKSLNVPFKIHKAKLTTPELINESYCIIAMTDNHKRLINDPKCVTLGSFIGINELPDPFGGSLSLYLKTAECILYATPEIINYLIAELKNT